jgi:hypothetical protein
VIVCVLSGVVRLSLVHVDIIGTAMIDQRVARVCPVASALATAPLALSYSVSSNVTPLVIKPIINGNKSVTAQR